MKCKLVGLIRQAYIFLFIYLLFTFLKYITQDRNYQHRCGNFLRIQSFFALWTKSHCVVKHNDLRYAFL